MKGQADIVELWIAIEQSGSKAVLATIVELSGSHYQHPGARMLFCADGRQAGAISGGCLQTELARQAESVTETGETRVVRYDTSSDNDIILGTGMGCGGTVSILLEPADGANVRFLMSVLDKCENAQQPMILAAVYNTTGAVDIHLGERILLNAREEISGTLTDNRFRRLALETLATFPPAQRYQNATWEVPTATAKVLIERIRPSTRLILFGAGDDALPVFRLAMALSWQVTVVDPRPALATSQRFPGAVEIKQVHAEEVGGFLASDQFDAALIMTHNYHRDLALLKWLLLGAIGYVGLLGARSRVSRLLEDLSRAGINLDPRALSRLYAPVGLNIGAESPEEIALAIIAEIQKVLAQGTGRSLRDESKVGVPKFGVVQPLLR